MGDSFSAVEVSHGIVARHVSPGDICIDATAGRGRDTAFLCGLVGAAGRVLAFDIQREAVESTRKLLIEKGLSAIGEVILDSHGNMGSYVEENSVSCIMFNFGWLPGGDHSIFTRADTSIAAIDAGLKLLRPGGLMSLCIYYGRDCGYEERDALLKHFRGIDDRMYTVVVAEFYNRKNDAPIPVFIWKS